MDDSHLETYLELLSAPEDGRALQGLRALQAFFQENGVPLTVALAWAAKHIKDIPLPSEKAPAEKPQEATLPEKAPPEGEKSPAKTSGEKGEATTDLPNCRSLQLGVIEFVPPGQEAGEEISVTGTPGQDSAQIAESMRDAFIVSVINKTTLKIKLKDIKDERGDIIETIVQAEYERDDMSPVKIWTGPRGEAAALAAAVRQGLKAALPDLVTS